MYSAVKTFHANIYGRRVKVFVDHLTLTAIKVATRTDKISLTVATWMVFLIENDLELNYNNRGSTH